MQTFREICMQYAKDQLVAIEEQSGNGVSNIIIIIIMMCVITITTIDARNSY